MTSYYDVIETAPAPGRPARRTFAPPAMLINPSWPGPVSPLSCVCCLDGPKSDPTGYDRAASPAAWWAAVLAAPKTPLTRLARAVVLMSAALSEEVGAAPDRRAAWALLERAADDGHPEALFRLGFMAHTGLAGHRIDLEKARACYEGAALLGHSGAQFNLGMMLVNAPASAPAAQVQGVRWVQRAADQRLPQAQCVVGILRLCGTVEHIEIDRLEAYELFRLSAKRGVPAAACNLGAICLSTADTIPKAKAWYDLAAQQNCPEALFRLANMHWTGVGVQADNRIEACELWHRAVLLGHRAACEKLRKILKLIDVSTVDADHAEFLRQVKRDIGLRRLRCWCCGIRKPEAHFSKTQRGCRKSRRCVQCTAAAM